jgi:hypothetical protein
VVCSTLSPKSQQGLSDPLNVGGSARRQGTRQAAVLVRAGRYVGPLLRLYGVLYSQKRRVIPNNLCSLLVFLPLAPPFLLNSLHLILHHVLGKALFEPKEAPILAGGVFDAVLATVHVE